MFYPNTIFSAISFVLLRVFINLINIEKDEFTLLSLLLSQLLFCKATAKLHFTREF